MKTKKVKVLQVDASRQEVVRMVNDAVLLRERWWEYYSTNKLNTRDNAEALRNYTALTGVIKALRWVLDTNKEEPLR